MDFIDTGVDESSGAIQLRAVVDNSEGLFIPGLFAIVRSIGIFVDDAIVVVEGATKHLERGKSPRREAAIAAMGKLTLVIAPAAPISAINALTLKPTQCGQWLRPPNPNAGRFRSSFAPFTADSPNVDAVLDRAKA